MEPAAQTSQQLLSTIRVGEIPTEESPRRWLIEGLWGESCVGVLGGCPKVGKSWLGLDMAVSVATGTPCLGVFGVKAPGPALVYLAEDALSMLRERVAGLARHRRIALDQVDLHVVTEPTLKLDRTGDRMRLLATADILRPRLILLDPLVRLHSANENDATEIAQLLSYFRELQRRMNTSVVLVHHTRKNGSGSQGGQSLRGSGDFWAFGDSNLYLRHVKEQLILSMEHRAAAPPDPVSLQLIATDETAVHLEVIGTLRSEKQERDATLANAVLSALAAEPALTRGQLRDKLSVKNQRLGRVLMKLEAEGAIARTAEGWQTAAAVPDLTSFPRSPP